MYEVLPDNNIRFGIRITNISDVVISDVEVILDYSESLFKLEGERVQKVGVIPPASTRTAEFILKPLGCVHKVNIEALISYRDIKYARQRIDMHPKEVHCVCPFLKGKPMPRAEFLTLSGSSHSVETGLNFKGVSVERLASYLVQTCKSRHHKVDDYSVDGGRMLYLASESIGEKAYYLLTALIKDDDGLTQVMLRVASDKPHGLNGFLNETVAELRHVVSTVQSAQEIGIIKKEQVINIIDSIVQRSSFGGIGGEGEVSVNIQDSVVQRTEFNAGENKKVEEELLHKKQLEEKKQKEEHALKAKMEQHRLERERKAQEVRELKERETALKEKERQKALEEEVRIKRLREEQEKKKHESRNTFMLAIVFGVLLVGFLVIISGSSVPDKSIPYPFPGPTTGQDHYSNSIDMEFVLILAGSFDMGSPSGEGGRFDNEGPVHRVTIPDGFYLGKYEVTQKQWREVMGGNPSNFKGDYLPVEKVSWNDAQEFIKKLNQKEGTDKYRLPSEAEWEYAARAGTTTRYFFGDDESKLGEYEPKLDEYAWYYDNSDSKTHPVGLKKPNSFGLYDIYGNVWEWTQDGLHSDYNGAPTDGSAWNSVDGSDGVFRGGGFDSYYWDCRSARRNLYEDARSRQLGFRVLRAP